MLSLPRITVTSLLCYLLASALIPGWQSQVHANSASHPVDPAKSIRINVGGKVGGSIARFIGKDATGTLGEFGNRSVWTFAAFVNIGLTDWISLQPEIQFAPRGADFGSDGMVGSTIEVEYIAVPLLASLNAPNLPIQYVTPRLLAGIVPSRLLDAKVIDRGEGGDITDFKDSASSYDIGLLLGIGASVTPVPRHSLVLEARYEYGLVSIDATENNADRRNRTFTFMLGYQFSLSSGSTSQSHAP